VVSTNRPRGGKNPLTTGVKQTNCALDSLASEVEQAALSRTKTKKASS
jgi:hypothetical protein